MSGSDRVVPFKASTEAVLRVASRSRKLVAEAGDLLIVHVGGADRWMIFPIFAADDRGDAAMVMDGKGRTRSVFTLSRSDATIHVPGNSLRSGVEEACCWRAFNGLALATAALAKWKAS